MKTFEQLFSEAMHADFSGWNFEYLKDKIIYGNIPWDYKIEVEKYLPKAKVLLDMGTGGGEFLSRLNPLPALTYATEAYKPNVAIAQKRLIKLGIQVVKISNDKYLPFKNDYFDLIINRHEAFDSKEVSRILVKDGIFITQQVGGKNNNEINHFFGDYSRDKSSWDLKNSVKKLEKFGFKIIDAKESFIKTKFTDIRGIIYYLRAIPWQIPNFVIENHKSELEKLHELIVNSGCFITKEHRFFIIAKK